MQNAKTLSGEGAAYQELDTSRYFWQRYYQYINISGWNRLFSRIIVSLISSIAMVLGYYFGKLFNEKTGWISAIIITNYVPYIISKWVMTDVIAGLC